jgi:methionyl-tRNA formyltransferase
LHYLLSQRENFAVFSCGQVIQNGGSIASFCAGAGIQCTHQESSGQSIYDWVANQQPDIVFVIGFNRLIKMSRFATRVPHLFNVHFGHLPEFRGPNPVFWQLKKGVPALAISIHCINEHFDAGEIVWKKEYANQPFFSYGYVHQLMSHYLVEGVNSLLQRKKQGLPIDAMEQDERKAAYFGQPQAQDVCIRWNTMGAAEICDLVKACNPWNGGAITTYSGFEVRISDAEYITDGITEAGKQNSAAAGTIVDTTHGMLVSCINNQILRIHSLMVNGTLVPARFAANYGFMKGHSFQSS